MTAGSTGGSSPPSPRPASTAARPAPPSPRSGRNVAVLPVRGRGAGAPASAPAAAAGRTRRPDRPEWDIRADVVGRAMRLIADGVVDRDGVSGLARRLGYTERHLHRHAHRRGGGRTARAGPGAAGADRPDPGGDHRPAVAEVAFAAGFGSVRQFNDTVRQVYGQPPSALRSAAAARTAPDAGDAAPAACRTAPRCTPRRCSTSWRPRGARGRGAARRRRTAGRCGCRTAPRR